MEIVIGTTSAVLLIIVGIFGLSTFCKMVKVLINIQKYDELERNVVYETFAVSFSVIILVHLIQLISSFTKFDFSYLISAGGFFNGGLISNGPLHMDSFMFDLVVLGVVYKLKKKKYGLK